MTIATARVAISGNTFPVKDQLKALGGRWDAERKAWMVPADRADQARQLVAVAPRTGRQYPASSPAAYGVPTGRRRYRDHEDCLSLGPCGPSCEYAHIFSRRR